MKKSTYVQDLAVKYQETKCDRTFGELHKNVVRGLTAYVKKIVKDEDETHDVVSEAFINAQQKIMMFNPDYKFTTWIYKIASNIALYGLRIKNKKKVYSFDTFFAGKDDKAGMNESWLINNAAIPVSTEISMDMDGEYNDNAVEDLFYNAMDVISELSDFSSGILLEYLNGVDLKTLAEKHDVGYSTMRNAVFCARHEVHGRLKGTVAEKEWRYYNNVTQHNRSDYNLAAGFKK